MGDIFVPLLLATIRKRHPVTYYTIRNLNQPGQLNPFRATPALYELLGEVWVLLSLQESLDPHNLSQLTITYD